MLSLTLAVIAIAVPVENSWLAGWCCVALSWVHALIHATINRLYRPTPVFMASLYVLLAM